MRRKLFTLCSATSLLLCLATCALWVRSHWRIDLLGREGRECASHWQRGGTVCSAGGTLNIDWWIRENEPSRSPSAAAWGYHSWPLQSISDAWHGFSYNAQSWNSARPASDGSARPPRMTYSHAVSVPHALPVILFALAPALWILRTRRRRRVESRIKQHLCPACGYDLRATPGRCPECGAGAG